MNMCEPFAFTTVVFLPLKLLKAKDKGKWDPAEFEYLMISAAASPFY